MIRYVPVGKTLSKKDAAIWGKTLAKLSGNPQDLGVSPQKIVAEAKKKSSPIHRFFTWDVKKAAQERWLDQARYYSRSVAVVYVAPKTQEETVVRAFHSASSKDGAPRYFSLTDVMSDDKLKAQVLKAAHTELQSWVTKYQIYTELAAIVGPIKKFLKQT